MKKAFFILLAMATMIVAMNSCGGSGANITKSSERLSGTYYLANSSWNEYTFTFSGNKYKWVGKQSNEEYMEEGTYELSVEYKEKGFSRGVITFDSRSGQRKENYSLEGNKLTMMGGVLTKK